MMQNVCFFNSTKFWGGGEKSHLEYAINFQRKNYKVFIVTSKGSVLEQRANQQKIQVASFKIGNRSFLDPIKINHLSLFFRDNRIDTVFLNSSPDLKLGGLAAKKAGVKNIIYMRGLAVPIKKNLLNKYLLTKVVTHLVPNSFDTRKNMLTNFSPSLGENKVTVIYRGINFEDWNSREEEPVNFKNGKEIILGNVGRLVEQKGQQFLIDIALKLKQKGLDFKFYIAGVGPLEEQLKKRVRQNNLENNIFFFGFCSNIKSFLKAIDIFVFPSLWEGFGNAMVEAMYEKKPVVAFNRTSNPEIVTSGSTGFLVDYPDIDSFADNIFELANNSKLCSQIGENAKISVSQRFSFDKILKDWENLLD